jgi:excisionase family DNA binding protein
MVMAQRTTITVPEISERLGLCEETVYDMLKNHEIPNLRHGHRFIVSRCAYEHWESTIGEGPQPISVPSNRPASPHFHKAA